MVNAVTFVELLAGQNRWNALSRFAPGAHFSWKEIYSYANGLYHSPPLECVFFSIGSVTKTGVWNEGQSSTERPGVHILHWINQVKDQQKWFYAFCSLDCQSSVFMESNPKRFQVSVGYYYVPWKTSIPRWLVHFRSALVSWKFKCLRGFYFGLLSVSGVNRAPHYHFMLTIASLTSSSRFTLHNETN